MNLGRKITGGRYHKRRKKRHSERTIRSHFATIGESKRKSTRSLGGNRKTIILRTDQVNIIVDGKAKKAQIKKVLETPQNIFFSRSNKLMKGAVIDTSLGKAKITNRPGSEGSVNAVLVKE